MFGPKPSAVALLQLTSRNGSNALRQARRHYAAPAGSDDAHDAPADNDLPPAGASDAPQ
jgi:hypothetical protein